MSRVMELYLYYKSGEKTLTPYEPFTCKAAETTFDKMLVMEFEGAQIRMEALPGHTAGSSLITYRELGEAPVIFCGDYLLPDKKVVTRLPGGDTEVYEAYAKKRLAGIPNGTRIFPGHGEAFQMNDEVRRYHEL